MLIKFEEILVSGLVWAQNCQQCGVEPGVREVSPPFLSVQLYQCFPPSCLCCSNACCLRMSSQVNAARQSTQTYLHEAQVYNLILDPHHKPCRPLHFVCAFVCVRYIVHAFEKCARTVALYQSGPFSIESRLRIGV